MKFLLRYVLIGIFLFKLTGCGKNEEAVADLSAAVTISGTVQLTGNATPMLKSFGEKIHYSGQIINFATIVVVANNQRYSTETDHLGRFSLTVFSSEPSKIFYIYVYRGTQYFEKIIKTGQNVSNIQVNIDDNDLFTSVIKNAYKEYFDLPEDFIYGFNDTGLAASNFYKYFYDNYQNILNGYTDFKNSQKFCTAKLFLIESDNYVVWTSPSPFIGNFFDGTKTSISICFSNSMRTDIDWKTWLSITPDTIINQDNPPDLIWNDKKNKVTLILNELDYFPANSDITVNVDSYLLNVNNQPVEPYKWTFKTGSENIVNCRNYFCFPDNSKYVFFTPMDLVPWKKYYGLYEITDSGVSTEGKTVSMYCDVDNNIEFLLKTDGLYITRFFNDGIKILFPSPVKLLSYSSRINEKFITNYSNYTYESKLISLSDKLQNIEKFGNTLTVELKLPASISGDISFIYFYFSEFNGLTMFSVPGSQNRFVQKILSSPKYIFPYQNAVLNKNSLKFVFEKGNYCELGRLQIATDTAFDYYSLKYDTWVIEGKINVSLPLLSSDSDYYYRMASVYHPTQQNIKSEWSEVRHFRLTDNDGINIITTPPPIGFKGYSYKYSMSSDNTANILYTLSKFPAGMKINSENGYITWNIPEYVDSDSYCAEFICANYDKGTYIKQLLSIKILDGKLIGIWQNMNYSLYLYSDCSFRFDEPASDEITGNFDVSGDTIILNNNSNTKLLTDYRFSDTKLIFNYNGNTLTLSKNGELY
ncbi:hypothetical protein KA977_12500 [Candidatus Dependentiae bacterium]|nr:hypothetical protein [Candidatus Dependentiae bacterium]